MKTRKDPDTRPRAVEGGMIIYPVCRCELPVGELRGFHFADYDGARIDKTLYRNGSGVGRWVECVPSSVAVAGAHT